MNTIGKTIKDKREQKNWSQYEFARKMDVTPQAISSWETGRTEPKMAAIEKMAILFSCSKSELLDGISADASVPSYMLPKPSFVVSTDPSTDEIFDYAKKLSHLPKEKQQIIYQMIDSLL